MEAALFLDRDGVLIQDKHYLANPEEVELIPGVKEALRLAKKLHYRLFLFTNQSGIGRGYYTWDDVYACQARLYELLGVEESFFDGVCIAPEAPDEPMVYRKPSPRFIQEMLIKHNLSANESWMIGDKASDMQAGLSAGIQACWVATGKGKELEVSELLNRGKIIEKADLSAFVALLL